MNTYVNQIVFEASSSAELVSNLDAAAAADQPLAIYWTPSSIESNRYMYVPVWTGRAKHYSHCERVVLRYDTKTGVLTCQCSKSRSCIQTKLARIHLTVNKPSMPVSVTDMDDDNNQVDHPL